jgi:hypothetical protein
MVGDANGPSPQPPVGSTVPAAKRAESKKGGVPKTHRIRDGAIQLSKALVMVGDASGLLGPLKTASGLTGMSLETWKVSGVVCF